MAHKIKGIAVYPVEGYSVATVRCSPKAEITVNPEEKYHLVCNAEIDGKRADDFSIEGSISKMSDSLVRDRTLKKKALKNANEDIQGFYRQWWEWENNFPQWKEAGEYEVTLKLYDKQSEDKGRDPIAISQFPVRFMEKKQGV